MNTARKQLERVMQNNKKEKRIAVLTHAAIVLEIETCLRCNNKINAATILTRP